MWRGEQEVGLMRRREWWLGEEERGGGDVEKRLVAG